ncbi:MAG: Histidine--tRNA ligase [Syntrophaceae bacterium PtaU1.Bin231]|nr:MAG: Histidine--tRNA ligase [Syntrophaceae bacterium PtaU1.Bin231]
MCPACRERYERNPLRLLDCKEDSCRALVAGAPSVLKSLCDDCASHFERLRGYLAAMGVDAVVDPLIVRGLDYYTRTVFEIVATEIGAQSAVCGGGRYDGLIAQVGGPDTPAMGFGMGMERLLLLMEKRGVVPPDPGLLDVYVVTLGDAARAAAVQMVSGLREAGLRTDWDHAGRSMKAQFKYADRTGCRFVLVLGEDELAQGAATLRDMAAGRERKVPMDGIAGTLKAIMGEK